MARKPIKKEVHNSRLLKEYASWIYCTSCEKTIAYLCYVTYDMFNLKFDCNCGSSGNVFIAFDDAEHEKNSSALIYLKNRLCCPKDESPLVTFIEKNLSGYTCEIACSKCKSLYSIAK